MKEKPELNEEQNLLIQEKEQEEESEISLDDLEAVSGSAGTARPRTRGGSRRSSGF